MSIYFSNPLSDEDYFRLYNFYYPFRSGDLVDVIERARERNSQYREKKEILNKENPIKLNNIKLKNIDKENNIMNADATTSTTSTTSTTPVSKDSDIKKSFNPCYPSSKESVTPDLTQVNTSNITFDVHTLDCMDHLKNYAEFDTERNDIESTLNSHELNDKINYILQFFFESFSKNLNEAIYNKSAKEIETVLEIPVYEEKEGNTYRIVMNQVAHKKAVKVICDTLQSKGFCKVDIKYNVTKTCTSYFADVITKVKEYYTITVQL